MNSLKLSKRVIGIALSVLFVNIALADANSDARIQAYKANKLIPQNIVSQRAKWLHRFPKKSTSPRTNT